LSEAERGWRARLLLEEVDDAEVGDALVDLSELDAENGVGVGVRHGGRAPYISPRSCSRTCTGLTRPRRAAGPPRGNRGAVRGEGTAQREQGTALPPASLPGV